MKALKITGFLILVASLLVVFVSWRLDTLVFAESVTTNTTVGNSPPSITAGPAESTASTGTAPTDEGQDVTFQATANEPNAESYYLAICKTDSVTPGAGGAAPTCGGGAWCVSTATASDAQASCSHTTVDGDAESNVWYAFVCDNNTTSSECSASGDQGTGDSGSPFNVNHDPTFTAVVDDGGSGSDSGADPGGTMTFTATASDSDTDTASDTVKLVVCADTTGATSSGCTGTEICVSSAVASNPSCTEPIPSVTADGSTNYYAYVFDSHDLGSGSNYISGAYDVNNVAPTVSAVTLNSSSDITLTEGTTTNVVVTGTVTDNNSCQEITTVEASLYRSAVTYTNCDTNAEDDDNDCYAQVSCSVSGGTCTGASDATADYTCTVAVQYHADPTVASTEYPTENWLTTMNAIDDDASSGNAEVAAGVEMNTLTAMDITASINFGSLDVGQKNDPLDKITTVTATGNVGLDQELSGTNLTDGGSGVINVGQMEYALAASTAYGSGTDLTVSATEVELNCLKTTNSGAPATKDTWWGIEIPTGIPPGPYSGTNTVTAVLGETVNW